MSEIKYKWISDNGPNSCEACAEHDGEIFDSLEDVPELPVHPNCKCAIEAVIEGNSFSDAVDSLKSELDDLKKAALDKKDEYFDIINQKSKEFDMVADEIHRQGFNTKIGKLYEVVDAINNLYRNYKDMNEEGRIGADKYFHAKAHAEAAQRGWVSDATVNFLSTAREIGQAGWYIVGKGQTVQEMWKDVSEDYEANQYGRKQGKLYPNKPAKELVKKYRIPGIDEKY
ncbi:MAG: hypothetical protein GY793_04170 [Proteobacteria bacterium]|nr:hypothetical protein [Pseudomonadota bacterium]